MNREHLPQSSFPHRKSGGFIRLVLNQVLSFLDDAEEIVSERPQAHTITANTMQKHVRKKNFVDSSVQGALLRRIIMHWVMYFFVAALAVICVQSMLSGADGEPLLTRLFKEAKEFTLVGLILLCIFPAFLLDTVRFSNRFVGPVGRLRRYLRQLGEDKNTERLSFRGGDFWSEMAEEFNAVAVIVEDQEKEIERLKAALQKGGVTSRT